MSGNYQARNLLSLAVDRDSTHVVHGASKLDRVVLREALRKQLLHRAVQ